MGARLSFVVLAGLFVLSPAQAADSPWTAPLRHPADADIAWRLIMDAKVPQDGCPDPFPAHWEARPLFQPNEHAGSMLRRFCTYTWIGAGGVRPKHRTALRSALARSHPSMSLGADRLVVVPMAEPLSDALASSLEHRFLRHAGAGLWPPSAAIAESPRLALIDTAPTNAIDPHLLLDNAGHGFSLANLARGLLCDWPIDADARCLATVRSRLALPYVEFDRATAQLTTTDLTGGGFFGSLIDLFWAISHEVDTWSEDHAALENLVINLSVGWDPIFGNAAAADQEQSSPAAEAVYAAILDARCLGVLIVAAAGNRQNGPRRDDPGALLPAAWQALSFDAGDCPSGSSEARKAGSLVFAAGGVDAFGRTLPNARPASEPPIVAFADHARVGVAALGQPGRNLTGSSVAALVVSSAAAAVWHYRPELAASEVMAMVYGAGSPVFDAGVPRLADVGSVCLANGLPAPEPAQVRMVRVCQAVAQVCRTPLNDGLLPCVAPPECYRRVDPGIDWAAFDNLATVVTFASLSLASAGAFPGCGGEVYMPMDLDPNVDVICPGRQLHGLSATPWTGPQPEEDMCPSCTQTSAAVSVGEAPSVGEAGTSSGTTILRIEVPAAISHDLRAPTIITNEGVFRLPDDEVFWPCRRPGSRCLLEGLPHDGSSPIAISFAVSAGSGDCDLLSATSCWSATSYFFSPQQ